MKRQLLLFTLFLFTLIFQESIGQEMQSSPGPIISCPFDASDANSRMGLSQLEQMNGSINLLAFSTTTTFQVNYTGNPPQAMVDAFQFALDIWANEIVSTVPITIDVNFQTFNGNTLASAGPLQLFRDFLNAPRSNTLYPAALANALAGNDLSPSVSDMVVNIGNRSDWYFGTDGNTPTGNLDFVTVVLHEIGHGLGFLSTHNINSQQGTGSIFNPNYIFDVFLENGLGTDITDYINPSIELASLFTSNDVFSNSPNALSALNGSRPKVYAPSNYQSGSSMSHWDEFTYFSGNPNALMTPSVSFSESNFDIGDITRGLFEDMGWQPVPNNSDPPLCPTSSIVLRTQQEVDDFAITYDVEKCNFDYGIVVSGHDVTNLNGLSGLTSIGGYLELDSTGISNLDGLSSLSTIGGYLYIGFNSSLVNINGLSNLTRVDGTLFIQESERLPSLNSLSSLTSVGGNLLIDYNALITNLDGLAGITSVGGDFSISFNPQLSDCNITAVCDETRIGGSLLIRNNAGNCEDLPAATLACNLADAENPVAICNNFTVSLNENELATISALDIDGGSTDNVGIVSYEITPSSFRVENLGINQVVLTVTDAEGNSDSCTANVFVEGFQRPFITTWKTDNFGVSDDNQISIPTKDTNPFGPALVYNYNVDWGDGTTSENVTGDIIHTYNIPGTYTISINGQFPKIEFGFESDQPLKDNEKLLSIDQWGDIAWEDLISTFAWCKNLDVVATDTPDLSRVWSLNSMFSGCSKLVGNNSFARWDITPVSDTSSMFLSCPKFNQDISGWNMSNVTDMNAMFAGATSFNQNIGAWKTDNLTQLVNIFSSASSFNQDISGWNVSKVSYFGSVFASATAFDQNLSSWNISIATDLRGMFSNSGMSDANYDNTLIGWSQLPVLQNGVILDAPQNAYCASVNERQSIIDAYEWTINDLGQAFNCGPNQQRPFITVWKTDNTGDSEDNQITIPTFSGATYDYSIDWGDGTSTENVSGDITHSYEEPGTYTVSILGQFDRIYFNDQGDKEKLLTVQQWGDLDWKSMENAFYGCSEMDVTAQDKPRLEQVTTFNGMFRNCSALVGNYFIANWDTSGITDMSNMFFNASLFNLFVIGWDVSNVTQMVAMFTNASAFNTDLSAWNISQVEDMSSMLDGTSLSVEFYDKLLVGWNNLGILKQNVRFGAAGLQYCQGTDARLNLIDTNNWSILDDARSADCPVQERPFITTWKTDNVGISNDNQITIPTKDFLIYDFTIDWGDGTTDENVTQTITHTYTQPGIYTIAISGFYPGSGLDNGGAAQIISDAQKLLTIEQWGDVQWSWMVAAFDGCNNMDMLATDIPNFSNVRATTAMFGNCSSLIGNSSISNWDMSTVQSTFSMFSRAELFNQDISGWNMSNVTSMSTMFQGALLFNQDLSGWNVARVSDMFGMLSETSFSNENYDKTLIGWSQLPSLQNDVRLDASSNQYCLSETARQTIIDKYGWTINDAGKAEDCEDPQAPFILTWDLTDANANNLVVTIPTHPDETYDFTVDWGDGIVESLVSGTITHTYNEPGIYDVEVTGLFPRIYFGGLSQTGTIFPLEITQWGDNQWTSFESAFFNANLGQITATDAPDLSMVTSMHRAFFGNQSIDNTNQSLNLWDVSTITDMSSMFTFGYLRSLESLNSWNVGLVTNMDSMFAFTEFNGQINDWNVDSLVSMRSMFEDCPFNQDISQWNVSNVQNMTNLFNFTGASSLSNENYERILTAWSTLDFLQTGVVLGANRNQFCSAKEARQKLIDDYGWAINDAGLNCPEPTLLITEIMYNPANSDNAWEYVEVYNNTEEAIDLSGYVIDDNASTAFTQANIPSGIIPAGESAVVFIGSIRSVEEFEEGWGEVNAIPANAWGILNNTGDSIGIWDSFESYQGDHETQANVIEQVVFENNTNGWPDDDGSASIYLTDLAADNTIGANWALSEAGAITPVFDTYTFSPFGNNQGLDIGSPGVPADNTAPVITLIGDNPQVILLGEGYTELGATTDDGSEVTINASEFVDAVGTYSIFYNATDGTNVADQVTRTVNVAPVPLTCPTEAIILTNQQAIDDFATTYDIANCDFGSISIFGDDITNLDGLLGITRISSGLYVENSPALTNLNGLATLTIVDGFIAIAGNDNLIDISGLSGLTSVSSDFYVQNNQLLSNCAIGAVCDKTIVQGTIFISGNTGNCEDLEEADLACAPADTELPVAICESVTLSLDEFGVTTISGQDLDGGSTDNVGIVSLEVSQSIFDISNIGTNEVLLTVTDAAGNSSSCTATVTIIDGCGPLPSVWSSDDIGTVSIAGEVCYDAGIFEVSGSGSDIWNSSDEFRYVYQAVIGDTEIIARVLSQDNTDPWAKAGVMMRSDLSASSQHALLHVSPSPRGGGEGYSYQYRPESGSRMLVGGAISALPGGTPHYLRMVREGDSFTGYVSESNGNWEAVWTQRIPMSETIYVGLAVTSHDNGAIGTAVFDNVSVEGSEPVNRPPTALISSDVTAGALPLIVNFDASLSEDDFGIVGYVWDFGDGSPQASGLTTSYIYQEEGVYTATLTVSDSEGLTDTDSVTITVNGTVAEECGPLPSVWSSEDIGTVSIAGEVCYDAGIFEVSGSGSDIWNSSDEFRYVYQAVIGDAEIIARVLSQDNTDPWAKAGVMMRSDLSASSQHALLHVSPSPRGVGEGYSYQYRPSPGSSMFVGGNISSLSGGTPHYLRMVREGDRFTGYVSENDGEWEEVWTQEISMGENIYVGLAVTSHDNGSIGTAVFDNVSVVVPTNYTDLALPYNLMTLSPNPAVTNVTVAFDEVMDVKEYLVFDIMGRLVKTVTATQSKGQQIQVSDLPVGTYFVRAMNNNGQSFQKHLVVKR